jgi:hypothetical protein
MAGNTQDLLQVLRAELDFVERGGYRTPRSHWRPQFIFEDSPTCLNFGDPTRSKPCKDCVLMQLVPPDRQQMEFPCRFIPLNDKDETIDSFYRYATQQELEETLGKWLRATIQNLEEAERTAGKTPPPENSKQAASGRI